MESNLDKIALDLYDKIQTKFPDVEIGDEQANVLSKKEDIPKARFFEFEYKENDKVLGTIAITLDAEDGVIVQISREIVDSKHHGAYKFIRGFRRFAKDRLLNFDIKNIGKSNLDKRDYAFQSKAKEEPMNPIMENKMFGTSRMSYQDLGEARLVVKHNQAINPDLPAGRTMHIENIYIENASGERFRYPHKHLNGARALAEHIKAGGNPYDGIGKHITGLSEELAQLRKFKGYVGRNANLAEAMGGITDIVFERIETIKKEVAMLQRPAYYSQFAESFEAYEEEMIPEEIVSDLVDRLTIRTFNEDLKSAFPYIFRLVDESSIPVKELDPEDLLTDAYNPNSVAAQHARDLKAHHRADLKKKADAGDERAKAMLKHAEERDEARRAEFNARMERESYNPEDQFESFMNNIYNENMNVDDHVGIFSGDKDIRDQAIKDLNELLSSDKFKGGAAGNANVAMDLKDLVPNAIIGKLATLDPELDVHSALQMALQDEAEHNSDLQDTLDQIDFTKGGEQAAGQDIAAAGPAPAPEATPPAPAPEATPPAPDASAPPVPPATPEETPPAPAPVAESEDNPPFDPPYRKAQGDITDKSGATHTAHSKAKHLAKTGLIKAIHMAKKAGAGLDTELDFGHSKKTLHDTIRECGMSPQDFGFEPQQSGIEEIMQSISGFWNRDAESQGLHEGNFTKGGTWTKSHVISNFKNGAYENATPDDVRHVCKLIDRLDPPSDTGHEQSHILKLAGVPHQAHPMEEETDDRNEMDKASDAYDADQGTGDDAADFATMMNNFKANHQGADLEKLEKSYMQANGGTPEPSSNNATSTSNNTQTGSINGQPASYADAMGKFRDIAKGMHLKMPGSDNDLNFDPDHPDQMGQQIQSHVGNMMKNMGGNMPSMGGNMDPQAMLKGIQDKVGGGDSSQGMDFKPGNQADLLQVDNPEYVARRAAALQKPGAVVGHTTVSETENTSVSFKTEDSLARIISLARGR